LGRFFSEEHVVLAFLCFSNAEKFPYWIFSPLRDQKFQIAQKPSETKSLRLQNMEPKSWIPNICVGKFWVQKI